MMYLFRIHTITIGIVPLLLFFSPSFAASFSIAPVRVLMPAETAAATVEIRSGDFSNSILLQVTAFSWTQSDGERVLTENTDLEVFPTVFKLEPGAVRTIFLKSDKSLKAPRYYRLRIEELQPETGDIQASQVAFLKAFDIPVFTEPLAAKPNIKTSASMNSDGLIRVELGNQGDTYFAATKLSLVNKADEPVLLGELSQLSYVLPGNEKTLEFNVSQEMLKTAQAIHSMQKKNVGGGLEVRVESLKRKTPIVIPLHGLE